MVLPYETPTPFMPDTSNMPIYTGKDSLKYIPGDPVYPAPSTAQEPKDMFKFQIGNKLVDVGYVEAGLSVIIVFVLIKYLKSKFQ